MIYRVEEASAHLIYNLLIGLVAPRPIALVTTLSSSGILNAAPFSAYNYLAVDPPVVGLGVANRPGPGLIPKDTARNIRETGEFVVNIVTEEIAEKMNLCSKGFPPEMDETVEAGLVTQPSTVVKVPQLAESPASLECQEITTLEIGHSRVILGKVVAIRVDDRFIDPAGPYIKAEELHLIGRMNGRGSYVKTAGAFFSMPRPKE